MNNLKIFWNRHGSLVMSFLTAAGLLTTVVLVADEAPKCKDILEQIDRENLEEDAIKEKTKAAVKAYLPALITGSATIGLIFVNYGINKKRNAVVLEAYTAASSSLALYRNNIREHLGEDADHKVEDGIANERIKKMDPRSIEVSKLKDDDKILCMESYTGRTFRASISAIERAEKGINEKLAKSGIASLNDFYGFLGLSGTRFGDIAGWSTEGLLDGYSTDWLDFRHRGGLDDHSIPCFIVDFIISPSVLYIDEHFG